MKSTQPKKANIVFCNYLDNFFEQIAKNGGQKSFLGENYINKNGDDSFMLQLCFYDIFA